MSKSTGVGILGGLQSVYTNRKKCSFQLIHFQELERAFELFGHQKVIDLHASVAV